MQNLFAMADRLSVLRAEKSALEAELKGINEYVSEIEAAMTNLMISEECQKFERAGYLFSMGARASAKIVGDEPKFYRALFRRDKNAKAMLKIYSQTLTAYVKELASNSPDGEIPGWMKSYLEFKSNPYISVRKQNKEGK